MANSRLSVIRLSLQNAWRWRWRLLAISLLVGLTCSLYLLYSGLVYSLSSSGIANIEPIDTPYYDMMLLLDESESIVPVNRLPRPRYNRNLLQSQEAGSLAKLMSPWGSLRVLGLSGNSIFFRFNREQLVGCSVEADNEIVLPMEWATLRGINVGDSVTFSYYNEGALVELPLFVVGVYSGDAYEVALVNASLLRGIFPLANNNTLLIAMHQDATLQHLQEWLVGVYPKAVMLSSILPVNLGQIMLSQIFSPGRFIMILLFVFMVIGVFTIAMMTFLERRSELAILKSIGLTNLQLMQLYGVEYGLVGVVGLTLAWGASLILYQNISWFALVPSADLLSWLLTACIISLSSLVLGLVYPILISKVATVNQLLFSRTIPLQTNEVRIMRRATPELVTREVEENLRMLHIPYDSGEYTCMVFKEVGDRVKQGEVIASEELYQGHIVTNYAAYCDGTVIAFQGSLVIIATDTPDAPIHPYGAHYIAEEKHHRELMERVRSDERERIAAGTSTVDSRRRDIAGRRKSKP